MHYLIPPLLFTYIKDWNITHFSATYLEEVLGRFEDKPTFIIFHSGGEGEGWRPLQQQHELDKKRIKMKTNNDNSKHDDDDDEYR